MTSDSFDRASKAAATINPASPLNPGYADLKGHLARLDEAGLLYTIHEPVNKDTELHPLVRWQFRGGIPEHKRKAFLFKHVVDSAGRRYDGDVVVGALAATPEIYRIGMNAPTLEDIGPLWEKAIANPIPPVVVDRSQAPCQEVIIEGNALKGAGNGLEALPIPISTPGFDAAPYITSACVITKDPDTGVQNMGTYRGQLKSPTRLGMMIMASLRSGGMEHWKKYKAMNQRMPVAIVIGMPPVVNFQGPQRLPLGVDEMGVAGGLAGCPIRVVKAHGVDLWVPAESEVVIEGFVETAFLEPEGPFGESHGYVALEDYNTSVEVTAITRRLHPTIMSIISQVTPSESSVIKKLAYEPLFLSHLKNVLGIRGIKKVVLHEALTNLRKVVFLQFAHGTPKTEVWRGMSGAMTLQAAIGKFVIAVDDDIDPNNIDAVLWAMAYRCDPAVDTQVIRHRDVGHGPRSEHTPKSDSAMLIDATMKYPMPPLALPKREYMEQAKRLWEKIGLPELSPESPWHGYDLGDWKPEWDKTAELATQGRWMENFDDYVSRRDTEAKPNVPVTRKPTS